MGSNAHTSSARTRRGPLRLYLLLLLATTLLAGSSACKKKPRQPPAYVYEQYRAAAGELCGAVVDCIKADTARRLADQPIQRDMVLGRMTRDLCVEQQYQLIGQLTTDPLGGGQPDFDPERDGPLYERYQRCVAVVTAAPDCPARRKAYFEAPDCRELRDQQQPEQ